MRSKYRLLVLAVFAMFAFGVGASAQSILVNGEVPKDLLITFERTPCFGRCPAYTLTIDAKGSVKFRSGSFTKVKGAAQGKLTTTELRSLVEKFDGAMFTSLKDNYDNEMTCGTMVTDAPGQIYSLTASGKTKKIARNGGCVGTDDTRPELKRLDGLGIFIDEITNSKRWTAGK